MVFYLSEQDKSFRKISVKITEISSSKQSNIFSPFSPYYGNVVLLNKSYEAKDWILLVYGIR